MLLTWSFHKERFPKYSGYSREMLPIHDWYSSYIAKGSFHWQHGVRGHRWNGLMEGGWEKGGCLRKHCALYLILSFLSSITLPSPLLSLMTSLNVRLQIWLGEIIPMTSRDSIVASANWTYIHTAQRCSLNPLNTFPTHKVKFKWIQRPRWRAIFGNAPVLVIYPVIPCKLVSQAAVFVTSRNTTPDEREGKGEEGGALCDETKTRRWETTYKLDLNNTTLDPWIATFSNLAAWLVRTLIKTLNFVSFSSFEFWEFFFCYVAQIQVLLTTSHFQIPVIIDSRTHKPFETSF